MNFPWKRPSPDDSKTANPPNNTSTPSNVLARSTVAVSWVCLGILVAGIIIVLVFGSSYSGKATIFEWMLACLLGGTFIGFLFGIPKILQSGQNQPPAATPAGNAPSAASTPAPSPVSDPTGINYQQQVNTNLTEISDWLTKIIVGLGLVNLTKIPPRLSSLAGVLAKSLIPLKDSESIAFAFAYGTIVTYTVLGFLFGYIITRVFLAGLFLDADRRSLALDKVSSKVDQLAAVAESANRKVDFALAAATSPTNTNAIGNLPNNDEQLLANLIQEYNDTRNNMISSPSRTNKMTEIIGQMTRIAPSVETFDPAVALADTDDGRRLAGYAWLYARPDYKYINNLVDAIVVDPRAFNQYWGIQALGKVQSQKPGNSPDAARFSKLKTYYNQLRDGQGRKYELAKIYPPLNNP